MKNTKKISSLSFVCLMLSACHLDGNAMTGAHGSNQVDYGATMTTAVACSTGGLQTSTTSGSTASCQVPDEQSILAVLPQNDSTLHLQVRKFADGAFPAVLVLIYTEPSVPSPHSVQLNCVPNSAAAVTGDQQEIICSSAKSGVLMRWYEVSAQDIHLQLSQLQISDNACGSTKQWYNGQPESCSVTPNSISGTPIGNVVFPDLYLSSTH